MSVVLVRGMHSCILSGKSSDWLVYLQVTGASGFVGSHVVSELLREGYTVRGFVHVPQSYSVELTFAGIVSAIRSHNAPRVSKSYESFGDRFTTVIIDDLVTSDLQAAVRGTRCADAAVLHLIIVQESMPSSTSHPHFPLPPPQRLFWMSVIFKPHLRPTS